MAQVGLFTDRNRALPDALSSNLRERGVTAEDAVIDITSATAGPDYDVVVDLASHKAPAYRSYLKQAALGGTRVINDPFWSAADDRWVGLVVAEAEGLRAAKTYIVPNRYHVEGVVPESLRNRADPISWEAMVEDLGEPVVLKAIAPRSEPSAAIVWNSQALMSLWNDSGTGQLLAQEYLAGERWRVIIAGGQARVLAWDPVEDRRAATGGPEPAVRQAMTTAGLRLARCLGYGLGAIDFGWIDGEPVVADTYHAMSDWSRGALGDDAFDWLTAALADHIVQMLEEPPPRYRWDRIRAPSPPP